MTLPSPTFVFGLLVLFYLSSFVVFAIVRIATGVSIQRIGYFSIRRVKYTPRDGCTLEFRGIGLNIHRPTFSQPTWLSIVLTEVAVTLDIRELEGNKAAVGEEEEEEEGDARDDRHDPDHGRRHKKRTPSRNTSSITRSETWKRLTNIKEKIKKLHRRIDWLRMVDVVARDSTLTVQDVGSVQVGTFTIAVDTRTKMVDRARLFFQRSQAQRRKRQAEWIITLRSVLFTAEGNESIEVLDHIVLNIHGFLYEGRDGLRNATISLKLGRVHLPVDDMLLCAHRYKQSRNAAKPTDPEEPLDIFLGGVMQEVEQPGSTNEDLMRTVSDSKEFFSSILRGIKEVQFAVSSVGLTKKVESIRSAASPILLNATMKEVGIDLHRLDPKSPAHRMYFPSKDIAHEALAAALSISVGLDDGHGRPERIVYIPMATTTVRTTLPSKTVERTSDESLEGKNANILFANSVVTSPSVDLDPRHLPLLIALLQPKPKPKPKKPATRQERRHLISRLLPKANIKFSMHEPVLRIKLKPLKKTDDPDDYDLIISSISSISLDMESSHSVVEDLHYSLDGALRLQSHHLYYQTNFDERFNLITTESFDMKVHLAARPDVSVDASGNIQSFSISMVRPEITDGLRQIVRELHIDVEPDKRRVSKTSGQRNFLRSMPDWLLRYHIEATDFNVEVAGIDEDISDDTRGVSLHLDHLSAEYRAQRIDGLQRRTLGRRSHSRSLTQSDSEAMDSSASSKIKKKTQMPGDGRKLVLHARGIDAQIMGSADNAEAEPFVTVPRLELAFSASSDKHGPLFNIQTTVRSIMMQYSLYRHYAVGVAVMTLRKAFMKTNRDSRPRPRQQGTYLSPDLISPDRASSSTLASTLAPELTTIDIKAVLVQIKADFPHEPRMMLHLYGLETGQNRWATPFLTSKLVRVFVEAPRMQNVWARLLSIKSARVDLREARRKTSSGAYVEEKMVDVNGDAVRFAVSHEVIVNRITDNIVNVVKSVQQLHHRFKTGTNEYILDKKPEGPKKVPKVSFRARNFLFELEDGAFEWKLGMIYRTGKIEQIQRIAREEAFEMKMKKIWEEEVRHGGHKLRSRSTAAVRGRTEAGSSSWFRSRSEDSDRNHRRQGLDRGRAPRYQPDKETIGVNASAKVAEEEARIHMHIYNSQTWKKRIDRACKMTKSMVEDFREVFWGGNHLPDDIEETEDILDVPHRPALMSALVSDLHLTIDKPTFALQEVPDFLHRIGKGMPRDMKYGLLVPMHVTIEMDEARVTLRDYPLPLLHIPTLKIGQSARLPAVSMKTNFVIAEEFRGPESTRKVRVSIIPPRSSDPAASNEGSFAIEVRRTIGPVKMYSDIFMDINTALPTRITWGPCYQPAIQDMMMAIEGFTKPQVDLSERVGFWDKIRLNFHSRINIAWKGDGEMHLSLKGTRDPYHVTGAGAGFLMCWRNDVRWGINTHDDPKSFMTVDSGEYIMAIPDYSHCVRQAAMFRSDEANRIEEAARSGAAFKKVVMKLSGKVQWMMGLMFERAIENGVRSFNFKPHYEVVLKNPHFAKDVDGVPYDAMRGFRSRHIHLSIAVRAPVDREWLSETPQPSRSYNTIHVTPRFFTHFFSWWKLFGQPLSLPIRQGSLFPGREKNSKKFGRHLATVKYNILLAPLFISHIYKHKDAEEYSENAVSATGLKVRLESFVLDLHQRREEFNTLVKSKNAQSRTTGIKIHAAQLDLASADVRAISASLQGTTTEAIKKGSLGALVHEQDDKPDISRFKIPDNDYSWIDMDDFVELDWILPTEPHPNTKILPLAFIPRLTYFRQTDRVQAQLVKERLERLNTQIKSHSRDLGEAELTVIRTDYKDPEAIEAFETLRKHTHVLHTKKAFLEKMLEQMQTKTPADSHIKHSSQKSASDTEINLHEDTLNIPSNAEFESDFSNRFVIHNMQLKWNNTLRNIVLRYIHQNSQRRGFIYYMSRPAIKFILDMIEERNKAKSSRPAKPNSTSGTGRTASPPENGTHDKNNTHDIEERILNILSEGGRFKSTSFSTNHNNAFDGTIEDLTHGISDEFGPQNSYHVRLIAPQIQLQSDKNKKHVVLITAKGMDLKVVEVMDKDRLSDDVSGLVQRRFLLNMDSTQFFVTHHKWYLTTLLSSHLGSQYGTPTGSTWPPWVPMEVMFDFQTDPFGFKRVVQKTSAMLRYDKYNNLRLKYNDEVNCEEVDVPSTEVTEARMDNLWVEFPQARAICNSSQYYAMYVIVLDLLMYNEPLEKTRSERLEKIMLASDFSDLSGTPEMVQKLQDRIRQMEEIKNHFQIYSQYLDQRGWEDRLLLERDLAVCEDELFFMMKAITTSQRKYDSASDSHALLKWSISVQDIVWHLMHDSNEPLVELQLKDLEYDRTDNSDGSHMNLFRVGRILGLNLLPDSTYPEMIGPYHDVERGAGHENESTDMIRVYWHMLEAIAGIPVMDRFEVRAHPMKVQLELEVGKRLFEYIFPGMDGDTGTSHKHEGSASRTNLLSLEDGDTESMESSTSKLSNLTVEKDASSGFATRAGSLELRLRPTLNSLAPQERSSKKAVSIHSGEGHAFRLFRSRAPDKTLAKKASQDSLRSGPRPGILGRSSTGFSSKETRESNGSENKKLSRFALRRGTYDDKQRSDDLTKMITRASNYMTFAHIKMPSVVLCLSYKGKDQRNFEDVHDFVFRLPDIEWQNKTWSNLDLALALKKAVVKALISHTGAIIGNKFSRHKPNAQQRNKLREMAGSSVLLTSSKNSSQQYAGSINDSDDSSSMYGTSPVDYSRSPPRSTRSTHSSIPGPGSMSRSSSIASNRSYSGSTNNNRPAVPAFLMMTPPTPVEGSMTDISGPGTDMIRPKTSASNLSKSPGRRKIGERPSTSASNLGPIDRRKGGGGGGFKDKFNALTHLMTHRDGSSLKDSETETGEGVPEMRESRIPTMNKRMSWAPGSKKGH
ncbi:mitochondrial protein from FMP27-domain-containing protein [Stachybotrys elegans]|uniref:Mitochondrial protein from FMP27-domain-containing protein n=1 Tax=Stachybotrys elegans TaxID=80388 RepID=A0A8K0SHB8_9HYPO|nr:mitochondrial protein from FMP27-domain-containing protein [Stachybotrys elegans]